MSDDDIIFVQHGALAQITLNRPKALNALTFDMAERAIAQLAAWTEDATVAAVVIEGAGEKAFCAGGDIRAIYNSARGDRQHAADFFRAEYRLNRAIHHFAKPYIALIDGITMGGGVGLSIHGSHRVATERTRFAMPETSIGLFPDVGASYVLPRLPGRLGLYIGLTGQRLDAADCLACGLATHYVPNERLQDLISALAAADFSSDAQQAADALLATMAVDPGPSKLTERRQEIERCFAGESVEAILSALEAEDSDWARQTLEHLRGRSPSSLKITFEAYRRGAALEFDEVMVMEYRLSQACVAGHDFPEGIRAVIIDKDNKPDWQPAALAEVSDAMLAAYFAPLAARDLRFD